MKQKIKLLLIVVSLFALQGFARICLIFFLVFCVISLSAQNAQNTEDKKFPNLPASPSPNAYEMVKHVDFPTVDNYGLVPISIPVFSIDEKDISHSVELNYHAGGIKVAQEATWVGLGWNLKAGGVITRSVRDLPDDEIATDTVKRENLSGFGETTTYTNMGWLTKPERIQNFPELNGINAKYKTMLDAPWDNNQPNSAVNAGIALQTLLQCPASVELSTGYLRFDCEPDVYYLSVNDISLKFIFGFDGQIKLIDSNQKISITPVQETTGKKIRITQFIVTDQKGIKYYFGGSFIEKTTVTSQFHQLGIPKLEIDFPTNNMNLGNIYLNGEVLGESTISKTLSTAWFLFKIESPYGNKIEFDYYSKSNLKFSIPVNLLQTINPAPGVESFALKNTWNNLKSINHTINTCYLKDIIFSNGTLHFTISSRSDVENDYKLDTIKLFNKESVPKVIKYCNFIYDYMNPTGTFKNKRMMLQSINIDGNKPYLFGYHTGNLPAKNSYYQDFWGYYSSRPTGLIPKIYVYPNLDFKEQYRCFPLSGQPKEIIIGDSDRTTDENSIKVGTLSRIVYPTKGFTKYYFEVNTYYDVISQTNIIGGGLRISSIEKYDNKLDLNNQPIISLKENYYYNKPDGKSSGILIDKLAFATPSNYAFDTINYRSAYYEWEWTAWDDEKKCNYFTVRSSNNFFPLTNLDGFQVGYTNVRIKQEGNGETVKEYYAPRNYNTNASTVSTSAINGFKNKYDNNPQLIFPNSDYQTTFRADCTKFLTYKWIGDVYTPVDKYLMEYSSDRTGYYKSDQECDPLSSSPSIFKCYRDLDYVGGNGWFASNGYIGSSINSYSYYVFGVQQYDFAINEIRTMNDIYYYDGTLREKLVSFDYTHINWGKIHQSGTNIFPFPPLSDHQEDEMLYGKQKSELIYKEGMSVPTIEKYYTYNLYKINSQKEQVFGIVSNEHFAVPTVLKATAWDAAESYNTAAGNYNNAAYFFGNVHGAYTMPRAWAKYYYNVNSNALLAGIRTKENRNGASIEKVESFEYNSDFNIKMKTETNSNNHQFITKYYYPIDNPSGINTTSTTINSLLSINKTSSVLKEEVLLNDSSLVSGKINNYKLEGSLIVPSDVEIAKIDGTFESKYIYDKFDEANGNILQIHQLDDINISFIWGYNASYPVAKIENATYSQVKECLTETELVNIRLGNYNDTEMRNVLNKIRTSLNLARVTTYTYKPLVGMTSQTTPDGRTTYYQYDNFGRLEYTRNQNDEIINKHVYHYATQ